MKAAVTIIVAIVLVGIGWFWFRSEALNSAPAVRDGGDPPLPVILGAYDQVATDCSADTKWESAHTRNWQALSQVYAGSVDTCMELFRLTAEDDSAGDHYVAVVTSAWTLSDREDFWYPYDGGPDQPSPIEISVTAAAPALGDAYAAADPVAEPCITSVPATGPALTGTATGATPLLLAGNCGGDIALVDVDERGATWLVTRPEEWALTVTSYSFTVAEGVKPDVALNVSLVGAEG
ncbi:hypothetical protein [Demequina sp.]|uniref:hypothetical protein n=1 Tax=Demequina sp. TaxID=2050685 RepID=UPI0025FAD9C6|nr:hypothetical protein [Demequina sp.]